MRVSSNVPETPKKKSVAGAYERVIKRNKQGVLEESGDVTSQEMYSSDRSRKKPQDSTGSYDGSAAPRVGGASVAKSDPVTGGTKKQMKSSKARIRKNDASPQAKKSAKKLY